MQHITWYSNKDDKPTESQRLKVVLQTERKVQFCLYMYMKLFKYVCCHKENGLIGLELGLQAPVLK